MKAHITVVSREKKGFLGLFGKKPAVVDIEPIAETTVTKANQQAVKGVPEEINAQNEPVKSVSEETVDLGRVVAAIKKVEEEGQEVSEEVRLRFSNMRRLLKPFLKNKVMERFSIQVLTKLSHAKRLILLAWALK